MERFLEFEPGPDSGFWGHVLEMEMEAEGGEVWETFFESGGEVGGPVYRGFGDGG